MTRRLVLNAGSGRGEVLPPHYADFDAVRLDIDPENHPDIVADVRDLSALAPDHFDAAFLSHLLEHFPRWEIPQVLGELRRVLKPGGFVEVRVPHMQALFEAVVEGHPIDGVLYESALGPITPLDLLYGWEPALREGNAFMAHQVAFTPELLRRCFEEAELHVELLQPTGGTRFELCAIGRKVSAAVPATQPATVTVG